MMSLRLKLLFWITLVLCFGTVVLATLIYKISEEELNDMLDESMQQVAYVVAGQQEMLEDHEQNPYFEQHELGEDGDFLVQVWSEKGELLYTTHKDLDIPLIDDTGFGYTEYDQEKWRYYVKKTKKRKIQILGTIEERDEDVEEIVWTFLYPVLTQLPFVLILAYFALGRGLKPLRSISETIGLKDSSNLSPIGMERVPKEIRSVVDSLNQLLQRLDEALKVQRQFTADAAHELRTPLAAIQIHIDNLERSENEAERKESLDKLRESVKRSTHMVQNLLTLARQQPEASEMLFQKVDLNHLLKTVADEYLLFAEEKNISLTVLAEEQPAFVEGDEHSLGILIENLLQNAILYTQDGGRVEAGLVKDGHTLILSVCDNGLGIAEEDRTRIFDRFYRVLGTKTTGSGLGLSIVKAIADKHNAHISVTGNNGDKGTRFSVSFHRCSN